ncbi:MAG TPA: cation:dicarboxylase symporter family transporter, partial [Polyangiaceae bacterium]|nr:cation:dicarboxylase symporter family transporter [Polyangiaceae bacterium]
MSDLEGVAPESAERATETPKKSGTPSLYVQVLIGIAIGILLGWLVPKAGVAMKPLGDGFVKLIKMLIGPIVFTTVVVGIAGMGDLKKAGRVGGKALLWFEMMTTVALFLGLGISHLVHPGRGIHAKVEDLDTSSLDKTLSGPRPHGVVEHLLAMIPESFVGAFTSGDVLQVLVIAVLTGCALAALGKRATPIVRGLEHATTALFA